MSEEDDDTQEIPRVKAARLAADGLVKVTIEETGRRLDPWGYLAHYSDGRTVAGGGYTEREVAREAAERFLELRDRRGRWGRVILGLRVDPWTWRAK